MANPLPEVTPVVTSMPTSGWRIQTGGSARRRVVHNKGTTLDAVYDVAGVPGHTHNASAIISVNADYTRYRQVALNVGANIWAYGALNLPAGLLTDSIDPDNADERYERAIERCVGYITLQPENCMSSIREPTRSIGEVRTLVTPKARLNTLTYVEEQGGWRVPDPGAFPPAGAVANTGMRSLLGSSYPDISIDMRPLSAVQAGPTALLADAPGNLFLLGSDGFKWRIESAGGEGNIGTIQGLAVWDGTITFKWDPDAHRYKSAQLTVRLNTVHQLVANGTTDNNIVYNQAGAAAGNNYSRIYVTFPAMQTSEAQDGYCWLSQIDNEEALSVATSTSGFLLAKRTEVEVTGILGHAGPFFWIGQPAYRIPVGSRYAHPGPDILGSDPHGIVYDYWDRFDAFREDPPVAAAQNGLLQYAFEYEAAEVAYHAVGGAGAVVGATGRLRLGPAALPLSLSARQTANNGRMFHSRTNGILSDLTSGTTEYNHTAIIYPYDLAYAGVDVAADTIRFDAPSFSLTAVPGAGGANTNPTNWANAWVAAPGFSKSGRVAYRFDITQAPWNAHFAGANGARYDDKNAFVGFPIRPKYYWTIQAVAPYSGDYRPNQALSTTGTVDCISPVGLFVPENIGQGVDQLVYGDVDFTSMWANIEAQGAVRFDSLTAFANQAGGVAKTIRLRGLPVLEESVYQVPQDIRNLYKTVYTVGNRYNILNVRWYVHNNGGNAEFFITNRCFHGLGAETRLFFESNPAAGAGGYATPHLWFWMDSIPQVRIAERLNLDGTWHSSCLITDKTVPCWTWNHLLNNGVGGIERLSYAALNAIKIAAADNDLYMYVLGKDWVQTHIKSDPFAAVRADSQSRGAVFQSNKRISQHICAPVINPNHRIDAIAPLNHDSRHLPPEMRDFQLRFDSVDWSRLGATNDKVTLNELTLFEFNGGVQKQSAEQKLMYLPQFQEFQKVVTGTTFSVDCFSSLGSPSFFCIFCRSDSTDILQQPLIEQLSIFNDTTKKKSNTITDASVSLLYHLTQRNVHAFAEYDRNAFNRRQTILLSSEDIGLMGLKQTEYQKQKRVVYRFSGTINQPGRIYVLFIYNNRGLHIDGRRLNVVSMHN